MQVPWARWWLWLWGAVAVGLIVLFFVVPLKWWAVAAFAGFGIMEGIGLIRPTDPYPPLTHIIRRYVPRWVAFTAIYGFAGGAGAVWLGFPHPGRLALLLALLGWLTSHFDVTFDQAREEQERAKNRRLLRGIRGLFSRKPA
jgi:ABC-type Fe3+ transport system permease subunit